MVELDVCREISGRYGLPLQFVMKEFRIFDLLGKIQTSNSEIKSNIIFKGGTAINKIYFGDVSRFSEDLDFDEISNDAIITRVKRIKSVINKIDGYEIDRVRVLHRTFRFDCFFKNELGQKDLIRIEFNLKHTKTMTANPLLQGAVKSGTTGIFVSGIPTYSLEDLLARKLYALYNRMEGKDVYDVSIGLKRIKNNKDFTKAIDCVLKLEKKKATPKEFIRETCDKLEKADAKNMKRLTNNYIPVSARPSDWNVLIAEIIEYLQKL
ncbi:MAG: nucleotidyl transferase AbiEii/AbiGii toxin family protein [Candidatus Aenigmarchaeota archaeon]|nr:nucleotidyl transferase AbiEii/AbiGii toxin family protein [Candidatus Aenigmarchaeota archaeon]